LFFRDFPTLDGSDFYSSPRGDLDTPLYEKKNKIEKTKFLAWERGGVPLSNQDSYFLYASVDTLILAHSTNSRSFDQANARRI
jgi:hypothetical protein